MNNEKRPLTGEVTLSIGGRPLKIKLKAPAEPVGARPMLPVFRNITNAFVKFGIEGATTEGRTISCKAGCGACCRQPVPISEAEAFDIAEYVKNLPEPQQTEIKNRFDDAFNTLTSAGWFEKLNALPEKASKERRNLAMDYFGMEISCPFLINESCSIHKRRPLACREYLVTSPASHCWAPTPETIETVDLPATPSFIFREISSPVDEKTKPNYLPLISALRFSENNREKSDLKTAENWLELFFEELSESRQEKEAENGD